MNEFVRLAESPLLITLMILLVGMWTLSRTMPYLVRMLRDMLQSWHATVQRLSDILQKMQVLHENSNIMMDKHLHDATARHAENRQWNLDLMEIAQRIGKERQNGHREIMDNISDTKKNLAAMLNNIGLQFGALIEQLQSATLDISNLRAIAQQMEESVDKTNCIVRSLLDAYDDANNTSVSTNRPANSGAGHTDRPAGGGDRTA